MTAAMTEDQLDASQIRRAENRARRDREMAAIMRAVAEANCLPIGLMMGRVRAASAVCARVDFSRAAHKAGYSLNEIGRALNRDHTTIMHYLRRADDDSVIPCEIVSRVGETCDITFTLKGSDMDRLKQASERLGSNPADILSELVSVAIQDNLIAAILDR